MKKRSLCSRRLLKGRSCDQERGTIAPLIVVSALLLLAVLAFAIDQGIACAVKIRQENALDAARDVCMGAAFALMAKNDDDPGHAVAARVAQVLHDEGIRGKASVWFYEAPPGELPASRRVWGIAMQVREDSPTVFAQGFGIRALPVASKRIVVAEPFADEVVWRPLRSVGNGCYESDLALDAHKPAFAGLNGLDEYPAELVRAVQGAIPSATNGQGKEEKV